MDPAGYLYRYGEVKQSLQKISSQTNDNGLFCRSQKKTKCFFFFRFSNNLGSTSNMMHAGKAMREMTNDQTIHIRLISRINK